MTNGVGKHLLFVWKPSGYELREADGDAPAVGSRVEVDDREEQVIKIGPSPLRTIRGRARTYKLSSLGEGRLLASVPVPGTGTKRMTKRYATQRSPKPCCIP